MPNAARIRERLSMENLELTLDKRNGFTYNKKTAMFVCIPVPVMHTRCCIPEKSIEGLYWFRRGL